MQMVNITLEFNLTDLEAQGAIQTPARIAVAKPLSESLIPDRERLQIAFQQIERYLSDLSLEIMQCLLEDPMGQARREDLECRWKKHPTYGAIRQAIRRLNITLKDLHFGYTIKGNRAGIYRLIPISK